MAIPDPSKGNLVRLLKQKLNPNVINGIKIPENCLATLQEAYLENFTKYKIRITQRIVEDVRNEDRICQLITDEHKRAHRNPQENKEQLLEKYYFPRMASLVKKYTKSCEICNTNKYDRHPFHPEFQPTPVPSYPCEILHLDIIEIQNEKFISCIDKFSKFGKLFHIKNRSVLHLRGKIIKIIQYFTAPKILVTDNESSFLSPIIINFLKLLGIKLYHTPVHRSEVNGQVERFHSTILEIYRCLRAEHKDLRLKELLNIVVDRYNNIIHSVTKRKATDVFFDRSPRFNFQNLVDFRNKVNKDLKGEIERKQRENNLYRNKKRTPPKAYKKGDVIYTASKGIKAKNKPLFRREVVAKNNKVTVVTANGRRVHKTHIKNV